MVLSSMTGFARGQGVAGPYAWAWEIKSVNAKGLDLRLRLPPGWDAIEAQARAHAVEKLSRGTVYANLTVDRKGIASTVKVNEPVLAAVLATLKNLGGKIDAAKPTLDGILSLKGVIEVSEIDASGQERNAAETAIVAGFEHALADLIAMRRQEGATLGKLLKARLAEQVAALIGASDRFDSDRLYQEAILLATKADIREELDRLASHVTQAKKLLVDGGPAGRRLDFLAQELNRESNTLTAKANDAELTNIGLELKSVVEQFREQVQNLE